MINPLSGFPPLPVPVLPESYDNSLSFYELLTKCWNQVQAMTVTVNTLTESVNAIEQAIGDLPQLSDDVEQLQLDLAAETQARSDGDDTLYNQINQVRTLVLNEYVSNDDLAAVLAGGIKICLITKADYDELDPPDASTLYVITDNGSVSLALAGTPVSQSVSGTAKYVIDGGITPQINGTIQE